MQMKLLFTQMALSTRLKYNNFIVFVCQSIWNEMGGNGYTYSDWVQMHGINLEVTRNENGNGNWLMGVGGNVSIFAFQLASINDGIVMTAVAIHMVTMA